MRTISIDGFEKLNSIFAGSAPVLEWLRIVDLVVDPTYQRPIEGNGRNEVYRIARSFLWSCFAPVVVARVENGKYAIIDGQRRTTAAALVGFDTVPCQIVVATQQEQAVACKALNGTSVPGTSVPVSRMAQHAAAVVASDERAVQLANICARADVKLLRYPIPVDRQSPGQTMAIGALTQCRERYGEETLITALQCVTQTTNNLPGALSARTIKALCVVLDSDHERRDSGLALMEAFDAIDLIALENAASADAGLKDISPVNALSDMILSELDLLLPRRLIAQKPPCAGPQILRENAARIKVSSSKRSSGKARTQVTAALTRAKRRN